ncbi:MAG: TolC family protein [Gammaproteobacteria bacterium]|nr:TolC family protein [Gammaproteobacteria bacterium]
MLLAAACARYQYEPEPVEPEANLADLLGRNLDEKKLLAFLAARGHSVSPWPPAVWNAETLTLAAFYFNPRLRAARAALDVRWAELATASQRTNPELNLPLEHHSDTSGGRSPWLIGLITDLRFERPGKRDARIERVRAQAESAWLELEATAWELRSALHRALIEDWGARHERDLLAEELELQERSRALLARRVELGEASAFELSQTQLELQRLELLQARQHAALDDRRRALVNLTGMPRAQLESAGTDFDGLARLPEADRIVQLSIREAALVHRLDMRRSLADYAAAEALLKLEIEKQHPDIVLSPGFIFDQDDEIWALGAAWTLPVLHRNDGPIREALAERELEQALILSLQAEIINDVGRRRGLYLAQLEALAEAEELAAQAERNEARLRRQFELGDIDRLAWLGAGIGSARARRDALALRVEAMRAAQSLENALQAPLDSEIDLSGILVALFAAEGDAVTQP